MIKLEQTKEKQILDAMHKHKVYALPFELKSMRIKGIGPIKDLDIKFKKHNLVIGGNATGKTTIKNIILFFNESCFYKDDTIKKQNFGSGEFEIEYKGPNIFKARFENGEDTVELPCKCLLYDDLDRFSLKKQKQIINQMKTAKDQTIFFSVNNIKDKDLNIIKLGENNA